MAAVVIVVVGCCYLWARLVERRRAGAVMRALVDGV